MAISFSFIASCLSVPSMALVQLQALAAACCTNSMSHGSTCKVNHGEGRSSPGFGETCFHPLSPGSVV
ncbi:hypothetical protein GUJ93_ZPchr0004g40214 [Zizania palustris]|uniref:Secreted protein n=1 Tax=Zizania palustris TaxID=103762 RepID=A0A8J5VZJ0_ZIZPA|nr:hypothetical protein GUJ93_ZPchr0004g40214 [Zizania palustris]